mmetsp:Transcript_48181/g.102918  ORF Transcript_48181/g.102918 Transcript_48181/m.102918 type:complete len:88 (+) Transcript_48181:374-637(+)
MVATMVRPSAESKDKMLTTWSAMNESRPEVGSSRKRIGGLVIIDSPMLTRFFWPPEMPVTVAPPMTVLRQLSSCSCLMTSSTLSNFC